MNKQGQSLNEVLNEWRRCITVTDQQLTANHNIALGWHSQEKTQRGTTVQFSKMYRKMRRPGIESVFVVPYDKSYRSISVDFIKNTILMTWYPELCPYIRNVDSRPGYFTFTIYGEWGQQKDLSDFIYAVPVR